MSDTHFSDLVTKSNRTKGAMIIKAMRIRAAHQWPAYQFYHLYTSQTAEFGIAIHNKRIKKSTIIYAHDVYLNQTN